MYFVRITRGNSDDDLIKEEKKKVFGNPGRQDYYMKTLGVDILWLDHTVQSRMQCLHHSLIKYHEYVGIIWNKNVMDLLL